jgi:hypothetical protein
MASLCVAPVAIRACAFPPKQVLHTTQRGHSSHECCACCVCCACAVCAHADRAALHAGAAAHPAAAWRVHGLHSVHTAVCGAGLPPHVAPQKPQLLCAAIRGERGTCPLAEKRCECAHGPALHYCAFSALLSSFGVHAAPCGGFPSCSPLPLWAPSAIVVCAAGITWPTQLLFYFEIVLVMVPIYRKTGNIDDVYNVRAPLPEGWVGQPNLSALCDPSRQSPRCAPREPKVPPLLQPRATIAEPLLCVRVCVCACALVFSFVCFHVCVCKLS